MASGEPLTPGGTYRRKPGDRFVRVSLPRAETVQVRTARRRRRRANSALVVLAGFVGLIIVGTLLLSLPLATRDGRHTGLLDALFTATSAVCVTGLVVVDTATHWSAFGQAVILVLIQLGGFGFMTSSIVLLLLVGRRPALRDRMMLGESMGGGPLGHTLSLVRRVAIVTLAIEIAGALLLLTHFLTVVSPADALWWSVFHSISAFNNAGFDLQGEFRGLTGYQTSPWILLTFASLIIVGGLSYTVLADTFRQRTWRRLTVDTKLTLSTSVGFLLLGMLVTLLLEWNNPDTLEPLSWPYRLLNAFFHSTSLRTAGFNALDISALHEHTLFFNMALMFIGGASGSTAGGIKVQTFSLLFFAIIASIRGSEDVIAFGRRIPHAQVYRALSVALLAIAIVFSVALILAITESSNFTDTFFETVSAFGTVGLSTGVTPELTVWGRFVIISTMFVGRLGPLTLVLALTARSERRVLRRATESVKIG